MFNFRYPFLQLLHSVNLYINFLTFCVQIFDVLRARLQQKSATGIVSGIAGNVDIDECYIDYPTIIKNAGLNGFKKSDTQSSVSEKNALEQILDHVASIDGKIK